MTDALRYSPESRSVDVEGCAIHYLCWNPQAVDKPPLLLAHGFCAHAHWWDVTVPALLEHYDDAIHAFNECNIVLMRLGGYAVSKLEVTDEAFSAEVTEPIANARDALESFRLNARHWKVQQWEQLAAPLPPQVSRLSSAPTKALSVGQRATRTPQRTGQDE